MNFNDIIGNLEDDKHDTDAQVDSVKPKGNSNQSEVTETTEKLKNLNPYYKNNVIF